MTTTARSRRAPLVAVPAAPAVPFAIQIVGWVLLGCGTIGAAAAFVLTVEKIRLLQDPAYVPGCSINPIISCGSVMKTGQAEVFGFPNPLIGLIAFPVVATIGVLVLTGVRPPRWVWLGLQAGATLGVVFVHWLFFQSLYRIGALCPYCMIVWAVTITAFWYVTLHNLHHRYLPVSRQATSAVGVALQYHTVAVALWLTVLLILIGQAFWDYWSTLV